MQILTSRKELMAQKEQSASATNVKLEASASMFGQLPFMPVPMMNTGMFSQALEAESPAAKKRKRPLPATARVPVPPVGTFNMPQCFQAALLSQQPLLPPAQLPAAPAPAAAAAAEPDDKDLTPAERKERRRIRNRVSAQLHRERQRQHVDSLEQQVIVKDAELAALRTQVTGLTAANAALQQRVRELEADAAAAAALSAAADSAVCCALAEVDFMDDTADHSSSDEATVLAGYSDSGGMTDGGTTSESHEESGDSSGLDSDMEDGVGGLWQQQSLAQPALARLNSYEAFQRTHLDDVQLDMSMFDEDTVLQEEGITINSSSLDNSSGSSSDAEHSSRGGVSVASRGSSAASLAFLSLMCVCTFMGGKYSSSNVSSVPAVTQRIAWAGQDSSAANSKSVAVAGASSPRHRVLRAAEDIASAAAAATATAATDDSSSSSRRRIDLQRAVQRSDAPQQQQQGGRGWVFSPAEKEPAVWRAGVARQGLAPWSYTRALDLFNTAAGGRWFGPDAQSSMGNKQQQPQRSRRSTAAARGSGSAPAGSSTAATGLDVDIYTGGNRGVDLYRGDADWESSMYDSRSSGSAAQSGAAVRSGIDAASPADKSYLYCPSAHGMMGPRMIAHAARAAYAETPPAAAAAAATSTPGAKGVPSAEALAERAVVLQQYPHLRGGGGASDASQGGVPSSADASSVPPADQYLTLLVPSGSVDWGRMSEGMSSFNSTAAEGGASEGWLEIGCQIMHARVVQGVSFTV
jgi:Basic region leucine zipper